MSDNRPPDPAADWIEDGDGECLRCGSYGFGCYECTPIADAARRAQDMQPEPPRTCYAGPALMVLFALAVMVPLSVALWWRYW